MSGFQFRENLRRNLKVRPALLPSDVPSAPHTRFADPSLVFETGPRSIRPVGLHGWLAIELVSGNSLLFWTSTGFC